MIKQAQEWGDRKFVSDEALEGAGIDLLCMVKDKLRASFDKCAAENGWPSDARPTWELRWTYTVEGE